jgi:alpha-beta hydrolase superfamily lysophospholipase
VTARCEPTDETFVAGDGYRWHYRRFLPGLTPPGSPSPSGTPSPPGSPSPLDSRGPLAEVVMLHGIQSHAGWYEHSCRVLAEAGFAVSFLDRRGSGRNQEARGDAPSFRRLLDDVAEYVQSLRSLTLPARRTLVVGISWGGKLAVGLQRRHPGLTDGLVLLCPGFFPQVKPSLRERLAIAWARLVRPARLFPIPLDDPELFTATPRWQDFLRTDPLLLHRATARFFVESVRLDRYLRRAPGYVAVPTLLLLAGRDRIIHNARTHAYVERFAGQKEVIEYPEAHHTLEFEPEPGVFLNDLIGWLRLQAAQG